MSEVNGLPEGWTTTKTGDLFSTVGGGTPSTKNPEFWTGDIPWITSADMSDKHELYPRRTISERAIAGSSTNRVPAGSVIVATRVSLGKVGLAREGVCFSQDCQALLFDSRNIDPSYVVFQMSEAVSEFKHTSRGTTIDGVTKKQLLDVDFKLAPLPEQRRIVAATEQQFSRLDAGIAALERVRKKLKCYRTAVLKAAVEGRLTEAWREENSDVEPAPELLARILEKRRERWERDQLASYEEKGKKPPKNWRSKYKEPAAPDMEDLPELPKGWCWTSMGQCFEVRVGATPSRSKPGFWDGDVSWVSSGEIQFCRISETKEHITEAGLANSSTRINPAGSILLGMIGEGRTRGQVAIQDIEAANNQNCAAIIVSETAVIPDYIYHWLWSRYEITRSVGSGNNQPALNKTRVQSLPLSLPPLDEQREIVAEVERRLSILQDVEAEVETNLKRASRLRQSILKKAFEGNLVPQDPTDEPASELLERIRAEREQSTPRKKRGKKQPMPQAAADAQIGLF